MAEEKLCPLLQKPYIRDGCKLWIQVTLSGRNPAGKPVSATPPEQCAFVWAGLAGLKEMQFGGRPAARRPAAGPKPEVS